MTADRDAARDQLAAALREHFGTTFDRFDEATNEEIADALLPVVDRIATERAAAELRDAAESSTYWVLTHEWVYTRLNEHADALDPT